MKNRTSLTLVISLLVCILTAGAFAQTNPSVLKPADSTLEVRESDVQPVQSENANGQCPYKVVPGDKVYLQIKNVKLRSDNLPLYPYFRIYGKNGDNWECITQTWSQDGYQICEKVQNPARFKFYVDNTCKESFIHVYSDYGNLLAARGIVFKTNKLIQWAKNPQNKGQKLKLNISKGNDIELKFNYVKKDRYYYFEIVSYKITKLEKQYIKYFHDSYKSKLILNKTEFTPEKIDIGANSVLLLTYNNKSEALLSCKPNLKYNFTAKNSLGNIDTIELFTNEIVKQLNDCMQKYPDDHTKWVVKCVSKQKSEIELSFAGIHRIYCITTVSIPSKHSRRQDPRYIEKGYAPWMRVYIQQNGEPCGINSKYARTGRRAWDCDVPNDKYNRFRIREGINLRFSLQIKDADTWAYEIALVEISGIKDLDFAKGIIYEKIDSIMDDDDKRTKIQFEEVKE